MEQVLVPTAQEIHIFIILDSVVSAKGKCPASVLTCLEKSLGTHTSFIALHLDTNASGSLHANDHEALLWAMATALTEWLSMATALTERRSMATALTEWLSMATALTEWLSMATALTEWRSMATALKGHDQKGLTIFVQVGTHTRNRSYSWNSPRMCRLVHPSLDVCLSEVLKPA